MNELTAVRNRRRINGLVATCLVVGFGDSVTEIAGQFSSVSQVVSYIVSLSVTYSIVQLQCWSKVWPHVFVSSRVLKLHNINLIQLYAWIAEM